MVSLRYFNPIGAHHSSLLGEFQSGPPHHLVPFITETATGKREKLNIFGGDWNTPDGTCVRDYIHVSDVAEAHINAMEYAIKQSNNSYNVFNIGSGNGYSVLEMVKSFEKTTGMKVPYEIVDRRPGDVEAVYADTTKASKELGFVTKRGIDEMLKSAWDWEQALAKE